MITNKLEIILVTLFLALFVSGCSTMPKYAISAVSEPTMASPEQVPKSEMSHPAPMPKPAMASPEPMPESTSTPVAIPFMNFIKNKKKSIIAPLKLLPAETAPPESIAKKRGGFRTPKPIQSVTTLANHNSVPEAIKPVSQLQEGRVAWNTPPTMTMGQSAGVELRVTLDPERFEELAKRVQSAGSTTTEKVDLSKDLVATLEATEFDVVPRGAQPQQVLKGRDAIWKWVISPKKPGKHVLLLSITSYLEGGLTNEPLTREIIVNALPSPTSWQKMINFVLTSWDKLLTVVLIPIGGWLLRAYLKRRKLMRKHGIEG